MREHVRAIFVVSIVRSILEAVGGVWVLLVAWRWGESAGTGLSALVPGHHPDARPAVGDREAFVILGCVLILFGVARFVQSLNSLFVKEWARKFGQVLAIVDFFTPLTLPLGLWALLVYRHPDTRDHFRQREPALSASTGG
jgi:hypothetical protein